MIGLGAKVVKSLLSAVVDDCKAGFLIFVGLRGFWIGVCKAVCLRGVVSFWCEDVRMDLVNCDGFIRV